MLKEEDESLSPPQDKLNVPFEIYHYLEKENEQLKGEIFHLKSQITLLRAQESDKRSMLWKKVQNSIGSNSLLQEKQMVHANSKGRGLEVDTPFSRQEFSSVSLTATKGRISRVPKPPPKPSTSLPLTQTTDKKETNTPPPPPPPPPPLPLRRQGAFKAGVKRVPEVVELYRALTRRDGKQEPKASAVDPHTASNAREMIGEIENRSAYLSAVSTYKNKIVY